MDRSGTNLHIFQSTEIEKNLPSKGQGLEYNFPSENLIDHGTHEQQRNLKYDFNKKDAMLPARTTSGDEPSMQRAKGCACLHYGQGHTSCSAQELRKSCHATVKAGAPGRGEAPSMYAPVQFQQVLEGTGVETRVKRKPQGLSLRKGRRHDQAFIIDYFTNSLMYRNLEEASCEGRGPSSCKG